MIKRLTSLGNSAALIIDKPILQLLHIDMNTDLELSTDGKTLMISPLESKEMAEFRASHARVLKRHSRTFRKLSGQSK